MKVKVDVLGRLGTFGLNVEKTKADRMWDELRAHSWRRACPKAAAVPATAPVAAPAATGAATPPTPQPLPPAARRGPSRKYRPGWFARLLGVKARRLHSTASPATFAIEVRRADATVTVLWPEKSANGARRGCGSTCALRLALVAPQRPAPPASAIAPCRERTGLIADIVAGKLDDAGVGRAGRKLRGTSADATPHQSAGKSFPKRVRSFPSMGTTTLSPPPARTH